jgi:hypothetical protein
MPNKKPTTTPQPSTTPATAAAPATPSAPANASASVLTLPLTEIQSRVTQALALWEQIVALFPGTVVLTAAERHSNAGKIREGEEPAMLAILKVADAFPQYFTSLVDLDEGVDPTKFETDLLRDRLARADALAPLADAFATQPVGIDDTVLQLRALAREPIASAYAIAKSVAPTNQAVSTMLAPALDYYRAIGKASAAARKANAAQKVAATAAATTTPAKGA